MRFTYRAACLTTLAITGLARVATAAAVSASSLSGMAQRGKGCTVTATIPVGEIPTRVAVNPKANTIYVTNLASNTVSVLSGRTNTVTATIPVGTGPVGVAADPNTNTIYLPHPAPTPLP